MKRLKVMSVFAIVLMILTGCSLFVKASAVNLIEIKEIREKLDSEESFILVIGNQEKCGPCESYLKGGLRKLSDKNDYKADYVMVDTVKKQKDMDILTQIVYEDFNEDNTKALGVPTTYIIKKGKLEEKLEGPVIYEELVKVYDKHINSN